MMKHLQKIADGFYPLTIFTKRSILDVWQGSEYATIHHETIGQKWYQKFLLT